MNLILIVILLISIMLLVQVHWNIVIIKGLHQIAKNQVGSTKMILEYLQVIVMEKNNGCQDSSSSTTK